MMSKLDLRLSIHHVGARYGNSSFPVIKSLEKGLVQVLFDADEDCLDEVEAYNQESDSEIHVLPFCFSDKSEENVPFHLNLDPFSSSLYKLNKEYQDRYIFIYGSDYPLKEGFSVKEQIAINTTTIDEEFMGNKSSSIPPPDFLSLDVQGAEYDILQGAQKVLSENVLAVCLEVEFVPLYESQACFGRICEFMDTMGFVFARFLDLHEFSPHKGPIGTRANGFHSYANALFLRKVSSIEEKKDSVIRELMLKKLAFISVLFNQMEFGLQCLEKCRGENFREKYAPDDLPKYLLFIEELLNAIQSLDPVYPVSFKNVISNKNCEDYPSKLYFDHIYQLEKVLDFIFQRLNSRSRRYSSIEQKMNSYGLVEQANLLWSNRIKQSLYDDKLAEQLLQDTEEHREFFLSLIKYFKGKTICYKEDSLQYLHQAISYFDEIASEELDQTKQALFYSLGSFLKSVNQDEPSRMFFEKLLNIKLKTGDRSQQLSYVYFHLGELEMRSEHWGAARKHFIACVDIFPSHRKAKAYIEQLNSKQ